MQPKVIFKISRNPRCDYENKIERKVAAHGDCQLPNKKFHDISRDI
jgi:hypothetical protein